MTRSSNEIKPSLGKSFWMQWILCNSLGHGVGLGLPILLADLLSSKNYAQYGVPGVLSFGIWVGFSQWIVLRQAIPVPLQWIWVIALSPLLTLCLTIPLFQLFPPLSYLLFGIYPLLISLGQGRILRRLFQSSWRWVFTSLIALAVGEVVGGVSGVLSNQWIDHPGISTVIGALCGGFIYSLITGFGLQYLTRQRFILPAIKKSSDLDSPHNFKSQKIYIISSLILLVVLVVWTHVLQSSILPRSPRSGSNSLPFWFNLVYGYAYVYLSILVHELGHLLFALLNGFDLKNFAVGRWVLVRRGQRLKLCRTRHQFASGFVSVVGRSLGSVSRRRSFLITLGGPMASFFLFCTGVFPLFFKDLVSEQHPVLRLTAMLSILNLHVTIFNLLPLKIGYLKTDGRRMLDLAQNSLQGRRDMAFRSYNASLRQGIRPRDVEPVIIDRALAIPEKSADHASGLLIAYYVALDKGEFEEAGIYLDQALEINSYCSEVFRGSLLLEGTYFEAHIRHRTDLARQWFEKIQDKALIEPYSLLRAEAALLLAEGDRAAAQIKIEQGLLSTQRDRFLIGDAMAENDWLQALLQ